MQQKSFAKSLIDIIEDAIPAGLQKLSSIELSRRSVLRGFAASTALPYATGAVAKSPQPPWFDLEIDLSPDAKTVTVREIEVVNSINNEAMKRPLRPDCQNKNILETARSVAKACSGHVDCVWVVPADAFGPDAWFDLKNSKDPCETKAIRLIVRKAKFGLSKSTDITFVFTRAQSASGKIESGRWRIAWETSLWRSSSAQPRSIINEPSVGFSEFVGCGAVPAEILSGGRVNATLAEIFDQRFTVSPPNGLYEVGLNKDLVWSITGLRSARITAFSGAAKAERLWFGWWRSAGSAGSGIEEYFFKAVADARVSQNESLFSIGPDDGYQISISCPLREEKCARLTATLGATPIDPTVSVVVVGLSLGVVDVSVKKGAGLVAGPIGAREVTLTEIHLPSPRHPVRRVLWGQVSNQAVGNAAQEGQNVGERNSIRNILTPIGFLRVGDPSLEFREAKNPQESDADAPTNAALARFLRTACGDKGGSPASSLFVVHDNSPERERIRRIAIDLSLHEAMIAVPDVSFSRLTFDSAELRLVYDDGDALAELPNGDHPFPHASSFIWIGPVDKKTSLRSEIDLSRAELLCARDYDLVNLKFRFNDFILSIAESGCPPIIRPVRTDCHVIELKGGLIEDNRPVLVVEFDPQHVFEESIFSLDARPFPDVEKVTVDGVSVDQKHIETHLRKLATRRERAEYREKVAREKIKTEQFKAFHKEYGLLAARKRLPDDQRIYVGPYALEPDSMAVARQTWENIAAESARQFIVKLLGDVDKEYLTLKTGKLVTLATDKDSHPERMRIALGNERLLEQLYPAYALFRDHFKQDALAAQAPSPAEAGHAAISAEDLASSDYFANGNIPQKGTIDDNEPKEKIDEKRKERAVESFTQKLVRDATVEGLLGARLSGPSRLAFRVNCQPLAGLSAAEAGILAHSGFGPSKIGDGGSSYRPIRFTFEDLTDWSRHEPAVTLRAQKLFTALPSGLLPPIGNRAANASDYDILKFQGFSEGPTTASRRISEIRASMSRQPTEFETAIEMPSRLIISTAQDAVWRTTRHLPDDVLRDAADSKKAPTVPTEPPPPPALKHGGHPIAAGKIEHSRHEIWTARLAVTSEVAKDSSTSVRVIGSPDFRPMAIGAALDFNGIRLPGHGAPPQGPIAPWFIGAEYADSGTLTPSQVAASLPSQAHKAEAKKSDDEEHCGSDLGQRIGLIKWLCDRLKMKGAQTPGEIEWLFRTALDANDRHQLVMLTSAFALPVIGKRDAADEDGNKSAGLKSDSDQFEPGKFSILDVDSDQAIYRPRALNVRELTLAALGGSFVHDTAFKPAAGAVDLWGRKLFDGFSIERWRHECVLGRDISAMVVYKGYLFPLGHRASLVKLTERVFWRTKTQGIKAVLRQRMFLTVGNPVKSFGAVGQPHRGRTWCAESVRLLTTVTPDIIDPTSFQATTGAEPPFGKLDLNNNLGLAFWPRTDITPSGLIQFQFTLDTSVTSAPLIFVDNIAATIKGSMEAIARHYNNVKDSYRTLPLLGQKIKFAPEHRPGDTSYAADKILIRGVGHLREGSTKWLGDIEDYATNAVLEGAEQPPFYPSMVSATIRLEQVERFSGGGGRPVDVQYDGHYVRNGFARRADSDTPPSGTDGNPLEVFLNLRSDVQLDMGDNGDRSAGLGRPNSTLIAISRRRGPVGGNKNYKTSTSDTTTKQHDKLDENDYRDLVSLADVFAEKKPAVQTQAPASAGAPMRVADIASDASDKIEIFKSYFTGDAVILGTVKFRDILKLLGLPTPAEGLPALKECYDYAAAGLEETGNKINVVKLEVLTPMRAAVERLRAELLHLDQELIKRQQNAARSVGANNAQAKTSAISIIKLYPEIDSGLTEISNALAAAIAEDDPLRLTAKFSVVYEAGRRMVHVLQQVSANPAARLQEAVSDTLTQYLGIFQDGFQSVNAMLQPLRKLAERPSEEAIADGLVSSFGGNLSAAFHDFVPITFLPPDLTTFAGRIDPSVPTDEISKIDEKLRGAFKNTEKDGVYRALIVEILRRPNLETLPGRLKEIIDSRLKGVADDVSKALDELKDEGARKLAPILRQALNDFVSSFDAEKLGIEYARSRIEFTVEVVERIKGLAETNSPAELLSGAAEISVAIFGVEPPGAFKAIEGNLKKVNLKPFSDALKALPAVNLETLSAELQACKKGDLAKIRAADTEGSALIKPLAAIITQFEEATKGLRNIDEILSSNENALKAYFGASRFEKLKGLNKQLGEESAGVATYFKERGYCSIVAASVSLAEARAIAGEIGSVDITSFENLQKLQKPIRNLSGVIDAVSNELHDLITRTGDAVRAVGETLKDFPQDREKLLFGAVAVYVESKIPDLRGEFSGVLSVLEKIEKQVVQALIPIVDQALLLLKSAGWLSRTISQALEDAINKLDADAAKIGLSLKPQSSNLVEILQEAQKLLEEVEGLKLDSSLKDPKTTLEKLLAFEIGTVDRGKITVTNLFYSPIGQASLNRENSPARLAEYNKRLQALQARAVGELRALLARIAGLPEALQTAFAEKINISGAVSGVSSVYGAIYAARNSALEITESIPLIRRMARETLLISPISWDGSLSVCAIESGPAAVSCDRLHQEAEFWKSLGSAPNLKDNGKDIASRLSSWSSGTAAPLVIVDKIRDLAAELGRGEILSMIDIGALRDEIEDALSRLIPVRKTLSYDFSSQITTAPEERDIFQPRVGGRFSIATRFEIDLLRPTEPKFQASGEIGPFDIRLVAGFVDAITLKFGGASFVVKGREKPRFDVLYQDFSIGKDLKFAQQLQSFLTPKDGSGIFLRPLGRAPGIEAGYGIYLGTIGFGATSFFNVSLNVSAELPFNDAQAYFKVSLGRAGAPFTISVLPFGGAGYFSIIAEAKGIVGFEAAFEFGGAGAIGYGPMQAQARIMVGVFIRVLKVKEGVNATTIYGTFFAGGSASIWIFHFSASLYVRMGTGDDGKMYGEAIYTFSFSLGLADFDYSITVTREEKPIGPGPKSAALIQEDDQLQPVRYAMNSLTKSDASAAPRRAKASKAVERPYAGANAVRQADHWDKYIKFFDVGLIEGL